MIYETFGNDIAAPFRIEEIVKTVVIPSEIRAGVASIDIQNETFFEIIELSTQFNSYAVNYKHLTEGEKTAQMLSMIQ